MSAQCWCCGLPMDMMGDGIGSCDCSRCRDCHVHHCPDIDECPALDDGEYDDWDDDGDWPVVPPVRPTHDVQVRGDLL